jgi:hypothetical protein
MAAAGPNVLIRLRYEGMPPMSALQYIGTSYGHSEAGILDLVEGRPNR